MGFLTLDDVFFMRQALREAEYAYEEEEIPVGAVVVCGDRIIARSHNQTEHLHDVTAHAELMAITSASEYLGAKYLTDCTLYVTLEPCVMCAGAIFWAQMGRVVYGASDPKRGYCSSQNVALHPKTEVTGGVLADDCSTLLQSFFKQRRK